ncbi:MAG TPA: hypothetical protein VJN96_22085 [Vicinamibacterales bacterium]|nr:hypothetical protein [Vicinamibacterales bacterium]
MDEITSLRQDIERIETLLDRTASVIEQQRVQEHGSHAPRLTCAVAIGLIAIGGWSLSAQTPSPARFQVVDDADRVVFEVVQTPDGLRGIGLNTESGKPAAVMSVRPDGRTLLKTMSPDDTSEAVMGVGVTKEPVVTLRWGGNTNGLATFAVTDRRPILGLSSGAQLSLGVADGGQLALGDAKGNPMVQAFVTQGGLGMVNAFPLGNPIGSFLLGKPR